MMVRIWVWMALVVFFCCETVLGKPRSRRVSTASVQMMCKLDMIMQRGNSFDDNSQEVEPGTKVFPCERADCPVGGLPMPGNAGMLEVELTEEMLQGYNDLVEPENRFEGSRYTAQAFLEPLQGLAPRYILYLVPCFDVLRGSGESPFGRILGGPVYRQYGDYAFGEAVVVEPTPFLSLGCVPVGSIGGLAGADDWCFSYQPVDHLFTENQLQGTFYMNRKQTQSELQTLLIPLDSAIYDQRSKFIQCQRSMQEGIFETDMLPPRWLGNDCMSGFTILSWQCLGLKNNIHGLGNIVGNFFQDSSVKCFPEMIFKRQYECDQRIQDYLDEGGYFTESLSGLSLTLCGGPSSGIFAIKVERFDNYAAIYFRSFKCLQLFNALDDRKAPFLVLSEGNRLLVSEPPCSSDTLLTYTFPPSLGLGTGEWCHEDCTLGMAEEIWDVIPSNCPLMQSRFDCARQTKAKKCKNSCSWCQETKSCIPAKSAGGTTYASQQLQGFCANNAIASVCPLSFSKCPRRVEIETCGSVNTVRNTKKRKKACTKLAKSSNCVFCITENRCVAAGIYRDAPSNDLCASSFVNECSNLL